MTAKTIIFIRHGESQSNKLIHDGVENASELIPKIGNPQLTNLGKEQSEATGNALVKYLKEINSPMVSVFISPFARTQQTAQPFLEKYSNRDKKISTELMEYTQCESKMGDVRLSCGDENVDFDETWENFQDRIMKFLNFVADVKDSDYLVVFGHSLFISCVISYISSGVIPEEENLSFRFPNCSISTIREAKYRWKIEHVASIAHLSKNLITGTNNPFANNSFLC
jgi:broad specificity phosphatase PhoE